VTAATIPTSPRRRPAIATIAAAGLGCAWLAARTSIAPDIPFPTATLVVGFVVLAVAGLVLAVPVEAAPAHHLPAAVVLAAGVGAFAAARALGDGHAPSGLTLGAVALNTLAAVSEEIWFRRVVYGWLAPAGPVVATLGAAALFAAVHVPRYGTWVLPVDLAAGVLLGWQRRTTGSWKVPAVTHAVADLLVLL